MHGRASVDGISHRARRFTITAVGTNLSSALPQEHQQGNDTTDIEVVDFAAQPAPLPNDHISTGPRRTTSRMPPPIPPPRRPFSWHRSISKASSGSGISPLDERRLPHFPVPSPEMTESPQEIDPIPNRVTTPPPAQRSFSTTLLSGCSLDRTPPFRQSSAALRPSPSVPASSQQRILRHHSSSSTNLTFDLATPTIEPPPPATLREPYRFATLSQVEEVIRRGPPGKAEPDVDRYISALADNDNTWYGSRDRLFIREESEGEEEEEGVVGARRKEDSIRRSTQTDRSSWASRQSRLYIS